MDHVGSTAVPGLAGKPVIDLFVSLQEWNDIENVILRLETLGYEQGEVLLDPPRCFLGRQTSGDVSFNIHLTPLDSEWGRNMLVFRDELAADQKLAERYADLRKTWPLSTKMTSMHILKAKPALCIRCFGRQLAHLGLIDC